MDDCEHTFTTKVKRSEVGAALVKARCARCSVLMPARRLDIEREPLVVGFGTAAKVLGISAHQLEVLVGSGAIVSASREPTRFRYEDLVAYRTKEQGKT